jgi:malate dehydrogenase (oxaloacetate-decarboxylating)
MEVVLLPERNMSSKAVEYAAQPKLSIKLEKPLRSASELALAYTPGVADLALAIQHDQTLMFSHTFRRNNLAVISDGSAVLGLGNIGNKASYPVMEGKAMLFKRFANIDAIPIIIRTQEVDEFVRTVEQIADSFAAINLEDISAPRCFEIETRLRESLEIPLMHDDQHGTAVVVLAAMLNALELVGKDISARIVISGSGAAGVAITKMLVLYGFKQLIVTDSQGILGPARSDLTPVKQELMTITNPHKISGSLSTALKDADVFIGVSRPGTLTPQMISIMNVKPVIFALANPIPEILPDIALKAGAVLVATGRSDFPNQINNALAFPGIFRGAIDSQAPITEACKLAAVAAIIAYHKPALSKHSLLPSILDTSIHHQIAKAVYNTSKTG